MRSLSPSDFLAITTEVHLIDVRRKGDFDSAETMLPGAQWMDPEQMQEWVGDMPKDKEIILYCVRGGGVSQSVVDGLQGAGLKARFIEGGIAALEAVGGATVAKA